MRNPATYLSLLALFVALGGTSYAVATGSIDSREIKNNSIRSKDVRNHSLLAKDFHKGELPRGEQGAIGPRGFTGAAGSARAYGEVRIAVGTLAYRLTNAKNVLSVTPGGNNGACIRLAASIDAERAVVLTTPIYNKATPTAPGTTDDTVVNVVRPHSGCPAGTIEVSPNSTGSSDKHAPFLFAVL